jgi:hypothetical protein
VREEMKDEREREDKKERKKMREREDEREKMERRWEGFSFTMIRKLYGDNKLTYGRKEREERSWKIEEGRREKREDGREKSWWKDGESKMEEK